MRLRASLASVLALSSYTNAAAVAPRHGSSKALEGRALSPPSNACSLAASASASYAAAFPSATVIEIDPGLAYDCLQTLPNREKPALDLLNSLRSWIEFQSDKNTYLLNPPEGYLFAGVDIDKYVEEIRQNIKTGNYISEYDFQVDIQTMMIGAKDGHFLFNGDTTGFFTFQRSAVLASVSVDGKQKPQVYIIDDLIHLNADGSLLEPVTAYSPSPVKQINDIGVIDFLLSDCLNGLSQDPDSLYNQEFFQLAKIIPGVDEPSNFATPRFYPGAETNITFANGTTRSYPNFATVNIDMTGIENGNDLYEAYCALSTSPDGTNDKHRRDLSSSKCKRQTSVSSAQVPFYPTPVISHSANAISGYYLDAPFDDVAVVAMYTFMPTNMDEDGEQEFQQVLQKFLAAAVDAGKKKLVVDLQGNGGGLIDLGLDAFTQLFPSIKPNVKSNMRASIGLNLLSQTSSLLVSESSKNETQDVIEMSNLTPFAYQSVITPDAESFHDFHSFYGPATRDGGRFTNYFQNDYTNDKASDLFGEGIVITGTNNRTGFTQPFASENIIVLYDGFCASTCTTFAEFMKNFANVQSVAIGGRPQDGPMQGVGGIKGTQVFEFSTFPTYVQVFLSGEDRFLNQARNTVFENFTELPYLRSFQQNPGGVNGRNSFRIGDDTETPLQYVYEASDCRLWWTQEMLYDPTALWNRVAELAFKNRTGSQFSSDYCIKDSTGHPTSISGGWKQGTLGSQKPPDNAKLQTKGWIVDGDIIQAEGPADEHDPELNQPEGSTTSDLPPGTQIHKSQAITDACSSYSGDDWFVKLICIALSF